MDNNCDYRRFIWVQEDLVFIKKQPTDNSTDNSNTQQSNSEKIEVD